MKLLMAVAFVIASLNPDAWCVALADESAPVDKKPAIAEGYLKPEDRPNSIKLLPPPPAIDSAAESMDLKIAAEALKLNGGDRFQQAAVDANLTFPYAAGAFSCAIGAPITEADAPTLYSLLRRTLIDAGASTSKAKDKYRHARPFMLNGGSICTPDYDKELRNNGSYPSGHASAGWAWAEILAEIAPDRADEILARGREFGESRIACNVHWASDVEEGRIVGAATVVKLHANPVFLADLEKARGELAAVRAKGEAPQRDCAAEARALEGPFLAP